MMWHTWQGDAEQLLSQGLLMCTLSPSVSTECAQHMLVCLLSVLTWLFLLEPCTKTQTSLLYFRVSNGMELVKHDGKSAEGQLSLQPLL